MATSVVFIRNRFDFTKLPETNSGETVTAKISVCIPARNEEKNISFLLESLRLQDYPNVEVLVLDDQSEDNTHGIVSRFAEEHNHLIKLYRGKPKPDNWLGKPWACNQLGKLSSGEIILFLDADTTLQPGALTSVSAAFYKYKLDTLTVWPKQILGTFWENTVIPLIYYALLSVLPVIYVYRDPRWMPAFLKNYFRPAFAAANGQCIAFSMEAYHKIGGHESVKNEIVEDVELAKIIKKHRMTLRMFNGTGTVSCRMYRSHREMFKGLRKNFLAGFGNSIPFFLIAGLLHFIVFVYPFITLFISILIKDSVLLFLSAAPIGLILLHRLILSDWLQWNPVYSFTHPAGVLWFQWLGIIKLYDFMIGKKSDWKGRKV